MQAMRAKMLVNSVERFATGEKLRLVAVAASKYPADGSDENNTYAKFSPSASCEIYITNPALLGKFNPSEAYYIDFTPAT